MGKKSSGINGFAALAGLDISTGKFDENKKKQFEEERDRKMSDDEKRSFQSLSQNNNRSAGNNRGYHPGDRNSQDDKYVGAPYNFVPMWEKVPSFGSDERTDHNSTDAALLSGEIDYSITAVTPVIISNGKKERDAGGSFVPENFVKNHYGKYAIPGSSISGMIRSNVQILSQSSLADDIDDYSLMYREVGGAVSTSMNKDRYDSILGDGTISVNGKSMSILKNVRAGYIEFTGKGYKFYKTSPDKISDQLGEMNYYVLSERYVFEQLSSGKSGKDFEYLRSLPLQHDPVNHEFKEFKDENNRVHCICIGTDDASKEKFDNLVKAISEFVEAKRSNDRNKKMDARNKLKDAKRQCKDTNNGSFEPNFYRVSYQTSNDRIIAIGEEKKYEKKGYLVISGFMQEKKALYVIPEIDRNSEVTAFSGDDPDIRAYKIDYENKKNQLGASKEYLELPKKQGQIKPVFFIQLDRFYFGFTPHLRLLYDYTIHDGLGRDHAPGLFDYAKSLFGLSNEKDSYKSRVSFSDATAVGNPSPMEQQVITLGGPKPTSYNDYLSMKADGFPYTYNDAGFRLRGVKQYWLRDNEYNQNKDFYGTDPKKKKQLDRVASRFRPLPSNTVFKGKVRFHNLRREELGLLIWSIRLNKGSEMNIGKGKPYGYGRIRLDIDDVKMVDTESAYGSVSLNLNPLKSIMTETDSLMGEYKKELAAKLGLSDSTEIDRLPAIEALMTMKDSARLPAPEKIRYMDINNREYQNRRPLKSIKETLQKE